MLQPNDTVLMIGWEYPPHNSGGLGVACEGLTKALSDQAEHIYFTLPYAHPQSIGHMQVIPCFDPEWQSGSQAPFSVYRATSPLPNPVDAEELHALPQSELEQRVSEYAQLVQNQAKKLPTDFDVIHAHDWMSFPAAEKVKAATNKPFIAHVHSTEFDRIPSGSGSPFIIQTEIEGLHQADIIVAVSYYTKKLLIDKYGVPEVKIKVVHNGIDQIHHTPASAPEFAAGRPVVVFMGRLTEQKGGYHFVQVARRVLAELPNALFVVAGNGDQYQQLLLKTAFDQLSASVLFSGFLRDKQREMLLSRADIFVMPSLSEPFGLVALEAAQRHTPVIVSKTSGVIEVMPSAIAIDFWDVEQMARTITELWHNQQDRQTIVKQQLEELSNVTWQHAAEKMKQIYRQAFIGTV